MAGLYAVEVEPAVRYWLERLSDRDFGRADFIVGLLAEQADTLGEPYTRHLGGKVRELQFHLLAQQPRITYWPADHLGDRVPQGPRRGGSPCLTSAEDLRSRARSRARHLRQGGILT